MREPSTFERIAVFSLLVAALLMLAASMTPALGQARPKARRMNCAGNLHQIGLALIVYAGDDVENGFFPDDDNLTKLNDQSYLVNGKVFVCPSSDRPNTFASASNYVYVGDGLQDTVADPDRTILAHDRIANHASEPNRLRQWKWLEDYDGCINILFADGSVKHVFVKTEEDFRKACAEMKWILPRGKRHE